MQNKISLQDFIALAIADEIAAKKTLTDLIENDREHAAELWHLLTREEGAMPKEIFAWQSDKQLVEHLITLCTSDEFRLIWKKEDQLFADYRKDRSIPIPDYLKKRSDELDLYLAKETRIKDEYPFIKELIATDANLAREQLAHHLSNFSEGVETSEKWDYWMLDLIDEAVDDTKCGPITIKNQEMLDFIKSIDLDNISTETFTWPMIQYLKHEGVL